MSLTFSHWKSPTNPDHQLIYVRGLPVTGKAYLSRQRGTGYLALVLGNPTHPLQQEGCWHVVLNELAALGMHTAAGQRPTWDAAVRCLLDPTRAPATATPARMRARATALDARGSTTSRTLDFSKIVLPPEGLHIYVDHREPEALVQQLRQVANVTVTVESLPVGDVRVNNLIFERKVVSDLESSIQNGRLFDEATRMSLEPETVAIVIVEGDMMQGQSLLLQSLQGAVTCLSQCQSMSVVTTPDHVATAYFILKFAQHGAFGLGYELPLHRSKPAALMDAKRYLLQAMPRVSGANAAALLEHFGSVRAVMSASRAELMQVAGIGPKTADAILEALG